MTSPWKHARGGWYVSVVLPSRRRAQLYLGKCTKKQAGSIAAMIESLRLSNALGQQPPPETLHWCDSIENPSLRKRLIELGLLRTPTVRLDWRLGEWFDHYIAFRADMKPNTIKGFKTARRAAVNSLGDMLLSDITIAQARQYARDMGTAYSSEHASKVVERARQVLQMAVESRVLVANPFADVAITSRPDEARQHYVDVTKAAAVLKACEHQHARAVFALARWCGLRVPHEVHALEWSHVDLEAGRLTIPVDTKTGARVLPLFPQARAELEALRKVTPIDSIHVIDRARSSPGTTYREWLLAAIAAAGLSKWEKLWINLRASCRTDLQKKFPSHVCDVWLGHSTRVAEDHYLQVTPEDWQKAIGYE
jgi:integrase